MPLYLSHDAGESISDFPVTIVEQFGQEPLAEQEEILMVQVALRIVLEVEWAAIGCLAVIVQKNRINPHWLQERMVVQQGVFAEQG